MNINIFKKIILTLSALTAIEAGAVKATPSPVEARQPDGTSITIIVEGDERYHTLRTPDGHIIMRDTEGYFCYATLDAEGNPTASGIRVNPLVRPSFDGAQTSAVVRSVSQRREAAGENPRFIFTGKAFPAYGEPRALVILMEYQDKKFTMADPQKFYDSQLNGENYDAYGATGSAREYFIYNSKGIFKPHFDVLGPVTSKNNMAYYGHNVGYYQEDAHPEEMVTEALEALDDSNDFSIYDHDGDGYIDNVFIIYAGYGEADSYDDDTIWPHSADLLDFNTYKPITVDGVAPNRYGMTCELDYAYRRPDGIGTFVHEFSHVLGLPDLYNTVNSGAYYTPGEWSALDVGPYNNEGRTPPNYSIFERYSLDWLEPETPTESGDYFLHPIDTSNAGFLLPTDKENEFFLIECRQQANNDTYIPNKGMLVWHIDFDQAIWDANSVNNVKKHQRVDIVEADNSPDTGSFSSTQDGDSFPGSKKVTELSFTTVPKLASWSGKDTGFSFHGIKVNADNTVSFNLTVNREDTSSVPVSSFVTLKGFHLENGIIYSDSDEDAIVYDHTGRIIGKISPGHHILLPATGVYLVKTNEGCSKIINH